jgi:putative oxidoreductase
MLSSSTTLIFFTGKLLLCLFFLISGFSKIFRTKMMVEYATSKHLPMPAISVILAAIIELGSGLAVIIGYQAAIASWILFVYLIPTSLIFHNFWAASEAEKQNQFINFMKNLAIMGGLLILAAH